MKNQITVRGLDPETDRSIRKLAKRFRISVNKAAVMLLRKGAGLREDDSGPEVVGTSLDGFIGSWSRKEETEFLEAIKDMEAIDKGLWQ